MEQSHEVYRALMRILGWGLGEGYYSHAFSQNIWRAATVRRMLGEGVCQAHNALKLEQNSRNWSFSRGRRLRKERVVQGLR